MTTYYIDTNLTTGLNDGTSWANAWKSFYSITGGAAGDVFLFDYRCAQTSTSGTVQGLRYDGNGQNPVIYKSVDKDNSNVYREGASFTTTGSLSDCGGRHQFWFGLKITGNGNMRLWDISMVTVDCKFSQTELSSEIQTCAGGSLIAYNTAFNERSSSWSADWIKFYQESFVRLYGCPVVGNHDGMFVFSGGSAKDIEFHDMSFPKTNDGSLMLGGWTTPEVETVKYYRCIKDALDVWQNSAQLSDLENSLQSRMEMFGCANSNENALTAEYRYEHYQAQGMSETVLTHYRTGGYDDGIQANAYSQKMVCRANMGREHCHGLYFETSVFIDTIAATTLTIELAHNGIGAGTSGKLREGEFWIELSGPSNKVTTDSQGYYGLSSTPDGSADLAVSTETWNGASVGTKQKVSITYTPTMKGMATIRIYFSPESTSEKIVYVDPKIEKS